MHQEGKWIPRITGHLIRKLWLCVDNSGNIVYPFFFFCRYRKWPRKLCRKCQKFFVCLPPPPRSHSVYTSRSMWTKKGQILDETKADDNKLMLASELSDSFSLSRAVWYHGGEQKQHENNFSNFESSFSFFSMLGKILHVVKTRLPNSRGKKLHFCTRSLWGSRDGTLSGSVFPNVHCGKWLGVSSWILRSTRNETICPSGIPSLHMWCSHIHLKFSCHHFFVFSVLDPSSVKNENSHSRRRRLPPNSRRRPFFQFRFHNFRKSARAELWERANVAVSSQNEIKIKTLPRFAILHMPIHHLYQKIEKSWGCSWTRK